ncbi:hypothetical protein LWI28_025745 [Acer negundo]|uniref:Uncharacterized protein n=1 Tax=Acer negundo TaxID=4023 RepID=A0AAD5P365_ACENE|nr:hypothetical protein LWI28_025745 [Acer negundo]
MHQTYFKSSRSQQRVTEVQQSVKKLIMIKLRVSSFSSLVVAIAAMAASPLIEPIARGFWVCKDGVLLLAGSGSGVIETSVGGGGKSFAQALHRPIPSSKYRIPLRRPKLINEDLGFFFLF